MREPKKTRKDNHGQLAQKANLLDNLELYEQFSAEILPMLKADIATGTAPEKLREKYKTYIEARKITIALTDPDSSVALAAARELTDRTEGKAVEKREVTHKYQNMPEEQLDAALQSSIDSLHDLAN